MAEINALVSVSPELDVEPWGWQFTASAAGLRLRRYLVKADASTPMRTHPQRERVLFVLRGDGRVKVFRSAGDGAGWVLRDSAGWLEPGIHVAPGQAYRIDGPAEVIEVSDG